MSNPRTLKRQDLMSLERYHAERPAFRTRVLAHKSTRQVALGEHVTLLFEDALTIQYQVQEMLRVERIFEAEGIAEELATYTPMIPDGDNWKATMMIEYEDAEARRIALEQLEGIERAVWVRIGHGPAIMAIADEDLDRSRPGKTAAVHFLRFPLTPDQITDLKGGAPLSLGVEHPHYRFTVDELAAATRQSLLNDLA